MKAINETKLVTKLTNAVSKVFPISFLALNLQLNCLRDLSLIKIGFLLLFHMLNRYHVALGFSSAKFHDNLITITRNIRFKSSESR